MRVLARQLSVSVVVVLAAEVAAVAAAAAAAAVYQYHVSRSRALVCVTLVLNTTTEAHAHTQHAHTFSDKQQAKEGASDKQQANEGASEAGACLCESERGCTPVAATKIRKPNEIPKTLAHAPGQQAQHRDTGRRPRAAALGNANVRKRSPRREALSAVGREKSL